MPPFTLRDFMAESLRIEGIEREPTDEELQATQGFLGLEWIDVADLVRLVGVYQPGAMLRDRPGLDVQVGGHIPPCGGPAIVGILQIILANLRLKDRFRWQNHMAYEYLHPFTDGNGRSGRALWLWQMGGIENVPLGFLHTWYYQSLQFGEGR